MGSMQGEAHDDVVFFVAFLECSLPEETLMFAMGVVQVAEEREVKGPREEERPRILAGKGAARHATRKPDSGGSEAVPLSLPPFYRTEGALAGFTEPDSHVLVSANYCIVKGVSVRRD